MSALYGLGAFVALGLFVYLVAALLNAEKL